LGDKLSASQEMAELSYVLATIKTDCDLALSESDLRSSPPDSDRLIALYQDLEFKTWLDELLSPSLLVGVEQPAENTAPSPELAVVTIVDQDTLNEWLERLANAPLFAFDTETTSLNYMQAEIVGVSFAVTAGEAAYVPLAHISPGLEGQLNREQVLEQLRPLLESEDVKKVGQHLKYDANVLVNHGITLRGIAHDTMLESYVIDAVGSRHDMGSLALKYLGQRVISFEEVAGKGAKQVSFDHVDIERAAAYAAEDADVTLRLHDALTSRLAAEPRLREVYETLELPLVPVLSKIERNGAFINVDRLRAQSKELTERLVVLEATACDLAGQPFNLASPKQLGEILFEKLELPVIKKTPKGAPSTAEDVLVELARDYELPAVLIEHRGLAKLKSTYTDKLPEMVDPQTGRIHTSYHQAITATGRLSSSDPNLQNIPVRTDEGRRIRQAFVAPEGRKIVAADYSQIELRIMAHLSSDAGLLHAFANELDVHSATASEVFDVDLSEVSTDQRRKAKAINFGLIYGMSAFGLAKQVGVTRGEAQEYIDRYFARYPGVADYMDATRALAHEQGFVETLLGRRLYLPEINARNKQRQLASERTAINAPMQGTAADIIKLAMIAVDDWLTDSAIDAKMIMQVHDELVFEVADSACATLCDEVTARMAGVIDLKVPLLTEVGVGLNWDEAH
jgi:DNA polymerase-1